MWQLRGGNRVQNIERHRFRVAKADEILQLKPSKTQSEVQDAPIRGDASYICDNGSTGS
jgi:hypothetical protein